MFIYTHNINYIIYNIYYIQLHYVLKNNYIYIKCKYLIDKLQQFLQRRFRYQKTAGNDLS